MLLKKDEPKKVDKPKKEKKAFNLENLFEDDPFPKYVIKEDPLDETMNKVKSMNIKIRAKIDKITKKFKKVMKPKPDILIYPKENVSINKSRKEEARMTGLMKKKDSSFVKLFDKRLDSIEGHREKISITLFVDIKDALINDSKTHGPFDMEVPQLSKHDMYKFMVYKLLNNNFTLLSAQEITKIGCKLLTHNKKFFMKHLMKGLKLESYLLNKQRPIKSHGENWECCVLDYVWDQVKGKKGFKTYDYNKLRDELYSFAHNEPAIDTEELIEWAKSCHTNVSIHAYDSTYRKFKTFINRNTRTDIALVYVVKDHHCFPITDEKLKLIASKANQGGADN